MKAKLRRACGVSAIAVVFLFLIGADEKKQVNWSDLNRGTDIIGSLGKRLGTYVTISGKATGKPVMMSNPLEVDHVNGVELTAPVLIEIECEQKLKAGESYRLRGYETGAMVSTPTDAQNPSAPGPQVDYHFAVWFVDVSLAKK
jgi:hypothetical protein